MTRDEEKEMLEIEAAIFAPAKGGRRLAAEPLTIEVIRPLDKNDIPLLVNPPALGMLTPNLKQIRHIHHNIARLMAEGHAYAQISLLTGYDPSRLSILAKDPAFSQLVNEYVTNRNMVNASVLERMRVLGLSTLEELQNRLESNPDDWTKRELMELAALTLGKNSGLESQSSGNAPGVNVSITFVKADEGKIIEGGLE